MPLILQNIHRYFLYLALGFIFILAWDAWKGDVVRRPAPTVHRYSASASAPSCSTVNVILLSGLHARLPLAPTSH